MTIAFRPLSEVKMILEEAGTDISYAYDDLVFVDHTAYLIQFDDLNKENLKLYFNIDLNELDARSLGKKLKMLVEKHHMTLTPAGKFSLKQKDGSEEIDISFFPLAN
ncbi:MAG: hypothetical protein AB7U05_13710 [Mangrovibacterium sp.]